MQRASTSKGSFSSVSGRAPWPVTGRGLSVVYDGPADDDDTAARVVTLRSGD